MWSDKRARVVLCAVVAVLAMALTVQVVQVLLTPVAASRQGVDAARRLPVMAPVNNPKPLPHGADRPAPQADFEPLLGAGGSVFDPVTSKEASRDEKSVTYANRDGSHSVVPVPDAGQCPGRARCLGGDGYPGGEQAELGGCGRGA